MLRRRTGPLIDLRTLNKWHMVSVLGPRRLSRLLWFLGLLILFFFTFLFYRELQFFRISILNDKEPKKTAWLLNTSTCKIPDYGLFPADFIPYLKTYPQLNCSEEGPKYLSLTGNGFFLNEEFSGSWDSKCKSYEIHRMSWSDSYSTTFDERKPLDAFIYAQNEFIGILCMNEATYQNVYHDFFAFINLKDEVEKRCKALRSGLELNPFSVLLLGIRSLSHASFLRNFRKTRNFLNHPDRNFLILNGYHKTAHGTMENLINILAGQNPEFDDSYSPEEFLDNIPFIWKDFANRGYRTLFADDSAMRGAFNYLYEGFRVQPTDYYFRPFAFAAEYWAAMANKRRECIGYRRGADVMLDWTAEFFSKFPLAPKFAFTYLSRLTEEDGNRASQYDDPVVNFLKQLEFQENLRNTVIIIFSEEGGDKLSNYRTTTAGILEDRTPFLGMLLPYDFQQLYPDFYKNLQGNRKRLVSGFDIYQTLQHLVDLKKTTFPGLGLSLFNEIPEDRTCESAWIPETLCSCIENQLPIEDSDEKVIQKGASVLLSAVNRLTEDLREYCEAFVLKRVLKSWKRIHDENMVGYGLMLLVSPGNGVLEGYVTLKNDTAVMTAETEFDNVNFNRSTCLLTVNPQIKKFCPCFDVDNYSLK